MLEKQQTITKTASISGVGLHTGNNTKIVFKPAPENHGIKIMRADLPDKPTIDADLNNVVNLSRGTTLGAGDIQVHTVEHALAALYGMQIDNVLVEVYGNEPPVMDGSAIEFVKKLKTAGIVQQSAPREYIEIDKTIAYHNAERAIDIVIVPSPVFRIIYMIDYKNSALGTQYTAMYDIDEFEHEYASSRTFCFLSETEMLKEKGLIKGGNLDNAIVFIDRDLEENEFVRLKQLFGLSHKRIVHDGGILDNRELRFPNEPVRHKVLDLLGDLALLGKPIKGHVMAARAGHAAHFQIAKQVREYHETQKITRKYQSRTQEGLVFDINAVLKIMPHRYPFLLVDRIIELKPGDFVTGLKNVTINEPFFQGHFPDHPIMPGVLILEAMGQVGGVLLLNSYDDPESKLVYFTGIDKVRFRRPVIPGDQLYFRVEMKYFRHNICKIRGEAFVGDTLATEAEMMAVIVDKEQKKPLSQPNGTT